MRPPRLNRALNPLERKYFNVLAAISELEQFYTKELDTQMPSATVDEIRDATQVITELTLVTDILDRQFGKVSLETERTINAQNQTKETVAA